MNPHRPLEQNATDGAARVTVCPLGFWRPGGLASRCLVRLTSALPAVFPHGDPPPMSSLGSPLQGTNPIPGGNNSDGSNHSGPWTNGSTCPPDSVVPETAHRGYDAPSTAEARGAQGG